MQTWQTPMPCVPWVWPNREHHGYYFVEMDPKDWRAVVAAAPTLSVAERISILSSMWASAREGRLPIPFVLEQLKSFDSDLDRHVTEKIIDVLDGIDDVELDAESTKLFRAYVQKRLVSKRKRLDGTLQKGTAEDALLLQRSLDRALVDLALDAETIARLDSDASKWLAARDSVPSERALLALDLSSRTANRARWDALSAALSRSTLPEERMMLLRAMGGFDDPALIEATLELMLTDAIKLQDARYLAGPLFKRRASRHVAAGWTMKNWDRVHAKFTGYLASRFVRIVGVASDDDSLAQMSSFLTPRLKDLPGADREFEEERESSRLRIALRANMKPGLAKPLFGVKP
jgi:aminopeptidase N